MNKTIILAVTGLPSSGKGTFSEIAELHGIKKFVMGDVIREECRKRGLEVNRASSDFVMVELRKEKGQDAVAVITLEWVLNAIKEDHGIILIDGIRSRDEIRYFEKYLDNLLIIGIHANPNIRLERALTRGRIDDAFDSKAFYQRDKIELNLGVGDVIALSDILIVTEESLDKTIHTYHEVIENIIKIKEELIVANN